MPADLTTYSVLHNLALGNVLGVTPPVTGYLNALPPILYAGDSFELIVDLYESYTDSTTNTPIDLPATATCTLKAKIANTTAALTSVATGAVGTIGAKRARLTFRVSAADLPAALAGASAVLIQIQAADATVGDEVQVTVMQTLNLYDHNGTGTNNPTAAQMTYTPATAGDWPGTAPDDVAEALDDLAAIPRLQTHLDKTTTASLTAVNGRQYVLCSTAGGAFTATLPLAATKTECEFVIVNSGHAVLTVAAAGADTIGEAGVSITVMGTVVLRSDGGTNWLKGN